MGGHRTYCQLLENLKGRNQIDCEIPLSFLFSFIDYFLVIDDGSENEMAELSKD
jgi:hypothetical protein